MKKNMLMMVLILMLWASTAAAQEAQDSHLDAMIGPGYNGVSAEGNPRAGEYEYLKSSGTLDFHVEYDPLPQRFLIETHFLNNKDYFGDLDYAYRDVVLLNVVMRGVYHNLDHYSLGTDNPVTPSPSAVDRNPNDVYAIENALRKGFFRFKTPDFPFHIYADALATDREGLKQQRFMRGYTGSADRVSETRDVDMNSTEYRVGMNSHLGPIEIDYNHTEKKFEAIAGAVMYDPYLTMSVPHNVLPNLTQSVDTVKLHTSLTGRIVAVATYADGKKKNEYSNTNADFTNAAGDVVLTPVTGLVMFLKYRHNETNVDAPQTATIPGVDRTYNVREAISSKKDVVSGIVRYRINDRTSVKGEYTMETINRDAGTAGTSVVPLQVAPTQAGSGPDYWSVASQTKKNTARVGITYRLMAKLSLRADYSALRVTDPAYASDPDKVDTLKATATWTPAKKFLVVLSYGGTREQRNDLSAPLAGGSRKTDRDQALGSVTFLVGKRSSITASAMFYQNKTKETLTYRNSAGAFILEDGVPYSDKAQTYSLALAQAIGDRMMLTAEATRCYAEGSFRVSGSVPYTSGIDTFSDSKVIDDWITVGLEARLTKNLGGELRYQHMQYNDELDGSMHGKVNTAFATVTYQW